VRTRSPKTRHQALRQKGPHAYTHTGNMAQGFGRGGASEGRGKEGEDQERFFDRSTVSGPGGLLGSALTSCLDRLAMFGGWPTTFRHLCPVF